MKQLLKTLIFSSLLLFTSQSVSAQRWGVEASYTLTGLQQKHNNAAGDFSLMNGCYLGLRYDYNFLNSEASSKLMLGGALLFEMRAGRYDINWYESGSTLSPMLFYGIVPIDLTFAQPFGKKRDNLSYFVFLGPRLNVGIFGSTKEHYYLATRDQIEDKKPFEGAYNRFDAGIGVGAGIQYDWLSVKFTYEFPLTNSTNNAEPNMMKQHQFKFSVGYFFPERKKKP